MKRTAIILTRELNRGAAANVAAILMGQAARLHPELYDVAPIMDTDDHQHASIRFSVVALEANSSEQLANYVAKVRGEYPDLTSCVFAKEGQALNNAFDAYKMIVSSRTTASLVPVGVIVTGDDSAVRAATKKFSVLK